MCIRDRRMDVSDPASVKAGVEAAQAAFGPIDILVSNAGICKLGDFLTQSDEDRDAHLDINVKGAWNTCKAVIPGMLERKWGKIVIMSSVTGDMVADQMCIRDSDRTMEYEKTMT